MNNEADKITQALRQTPNLKANPLAKKTAIALALSEFDKNNTKISQGNAFADRLKNTAHAVRPFIFGRQPMKTHHLTLVSTLCAFLVILAISPFHIPANWELIQQIYTHDFAQQEATSNSIAQDQTSSKSIAKNNAKPILPIQHKEITDNFANEEAIEPPVSTSLVAPDQLSSNSIAKAQPNVSIQIKRVLEESRSHGLYSRSKVQKSETALKPFTRNTHGSAKDLIQNLYGSPNRDLFKNVTSNPLKQTKTEPVSTFSIDVDTASYSYVRTALNQNVLPQKNAVRVEELINYFPYDYEVPTDKSEPFKTQVSVFPTPWNKDTQLLHIGIKGYQVNTQARPLANLVFLIDTSGSMQEANKLPLVKNALKMLVDTLSAEDSVAIVTYAGSAGIALSPTKIKDKNKINTMIDNLGAEGSTAGAEGIRQAYQLAEQNFNQKGINRVILATDGDFNVGITDTDQLKSFIANKRESGVSLSVLGFGTGNYHDDLMQTLAQNGNGNASYIDNLNEARKVLVEEASSTLFTIAKDVKIQVEFNPEQIAEYRLIGYETRSLNTEDFNNDKVDAGDMGAGHSVTALYEMTPVNSKAKLIDDLRYQKPIAKTVENKNNEYAFVKVRFKTPDSNESKLITTTVTRDSTFKTIQDASTEARFAVAVAGFGQLLRGDNYLKAFNYDRVISLAETAKGSDPFGYRAEFINLVRVAKNAPAIPPLQ